MPVKEGKSRSRDSAVNITLSGIDQKRPNCRRHSSCIAGLSVRVQHSHRSQHGTVSGPKTCDPRTVWKDWMSPEITLFADSPDRSIAPLNAVFSKSMLFFRNALKRCFGRHSCTASDKSHFCRGWNSPRNPFLPPTIRVCENSSNGLWNERASSCHRSTIHSGHALRAAIAFL